MRVTDVHEPYDTAARCGRPSLGDAPTGERVTGTGPHAPAPDAIQAFFAPRAIAVIGVSAAPTNLARTIVQNLVEFGFPGPVVPVGPGGGEVAGRPILPSVGAAGPVDLAVVLVPAARILEALEDCGRAGVQAVIISSGGFSEYEAGRTALEAEVRACARRYGFRVMGPNCIGVLAPTEGVVTPFVPIAPEALVPGRVSVISQSGGVVLYLAERLAEEGLGCHRLVSVGNKLDVDEADLLPALDAHPDTHVIVLYLEGIGRGRALLEAAARGRKPVVALKANEGVASAAIARSHTAALANDERVVEAALRQAGVVRVRDLDQVVACAKAFSLPPLRGERLLVASMSGGMSVIAADACSRYGFALPPLPASLLRDLEGRSRGGVIHLQNPLDLGDIHDPAAAVETLTKLLLLPEVDGAAVCLPSPASAGRVLGGTRALEGLVAQLRAAADACAKPVALSFFAGRRAWESLRGHLALPVFSDLRESIEALAFQRAYWRARARPLATALREPSPACRALPEGLRRQAPWPPFPAVLDFLEAHGLPVEPVVVARTPGEAAAAARALGGPVALKIVAPGLAHKTEVGGVVLGLTTPAKVAQAFDQLLAQVRTAAPGAAIHGAAVQRMRAPLHEVMIGARRDPAFGPVVLFGLGGIWVEVLGDVSLRLAPVSRAEAEEMIGEIRGAPLLAGTRGRPTAARGALADLLVAVSRLAAELPELRELDLNPVMVVDREATIVDARMAIEPQDPQPPASEP